MGKAEDDHDPAANQVVQHNNADARFLCGCCWIFRLIGFKCFLMLLFSVAVFLSALFWLPPFLQFADQKDLDLDSRFKVIAGHDIVATFNLEKPVSFLEDNIVQLEDDIYYEISVAGTKVVILSLEPLAGSNITQVVFGIDPYSKHSKISLSSQSLIKASFEMLVINQPSLRLTTSLFGDPFSFEVLKFRGGITVIPQQSAFLLQKVQIYFNFTLNFSIHQIQENFDELTSQLKKGLHLTSYENLYIRLSNTRGSTVASPTIVQSSVLLAIGNTPSMPRLKQLAQTIAGSNSKNLGLNNTEFGRVKQVRLSSILQHSLHGGGHGSAPSSSPSPTPQPEPRQHHQLHHQHHHRHHHHKNYLTPDISPAPAPLESSPTPRKSHEAKPPSCQMGHKRGSNMKPRKQHHLAPTIAPHISPQHSPASPKVPPTPRPRPISQTVPASSPIPNVAFAHAQPPSKSDSYGVRSIPSISPSPSSSSAGNRAVRLAYWLLLPMGMVLHI